MKIAISGDNHLFYCAKDIQTKLVRNMMKDIKNENPDVMAYCGDFGEVLMNTDMSLIEELFVINPTVFVIGNHDAYNQQNLTPDHAMLEVLKVMKYGIPLQKSWHDTTTFYEKDEVLFLGVIGWPDFAHERLPFTKEFYNCHFPTTDATYLNLSKGWLVYTDVMLKAFEKKLMMVNHSKCSKIIILTHYSIFESQYRLSLSDEISVYFYCHTLGEMVKHVAKNNPDKQFWCISGHGHRFNTGKWFSLTDNLTTLGISTDYGIETYEVLEF